MNNLNHILCPICGKHEFVDTNSDAICPKCGWKHDTFAEDNPSENNGINDLSLYDYKYRYEHYVDKNPNYTFEKNGYPEIPQVEPMDCPVCKKFRFTPLTWDDIYCGIKPSDSKCMSCGWHYDPDQHSNPDLKERSNTLSLNDYKIWYENKLKENPEFDYFEEMISNYNPVPHKCPICGKYEFADKCCFDICPHCGWEDDGTEDDTPILGANDMRFSEYKKRYENYIKENPKYRWDKDGRP